ncbi:hypothetical protein BpHYR1_014097 [Brachionus plicatilis]|uniref:Uncharacterized protein n=1 Tax=Brachionus plicatilis TaxID=10195 RepID=A0A3M7PHN2_BRAPC|nr:hypothetical protein BpHYR1_014097 [Brachionus plicatilis]
MNKNILKKLSNHIRESIYSRCKTSVVFIYQSERRSVIDSNLNIFPNSERSVLLARKDNLRIYLIALFRRGDLLLGRNWEFLEKQTKLHLFADIFIFHLQSCAVVRKIKENVWLYTDLYKSHEKKSQKKLIIE